MEDTKPGILQDPDFEAMTVADLEGFIQRPDAMIDQIRAQQARAHAVLERKEAQKRAREVANRPADFPPSQKIGG